MRKSALFVLAVLMLAGVATAWQVLSQSMADVRMTVLPAQATVTTLPINIGNVKSGYDFNKSVGDGVLTISNAKELNATITVTGLNSSEAAALSSCFVDVTIKDHQSDNVVLGGTINALDPTSSITGTLKEGTYDFTVKVYGTAGYPQSEAEVPIDFSVQITLNTPS